MTPEKQAELLIRIDERVQALGDKQDLTHAMLVKHFEDDKKAFAKIEAKTGRNRNWLTALTVGGLGGAGTAGFWDAIKGFLS